MSKAKIDSDVETDTNTKIDIGLKISIDKQFFYFPHTRKKINRNYTSLNKSAGYEDGEINGI
jgi:hypothetical protein